MHGPATKPAESRAGAAGARSGDGDGDAYRIIQVHPTRRCNLRCLHCYSTSGPEQREELSPALLVAALEAARAEGYVTASFSGGEPLLYRPLASVLAAARRLGMTVTVTTNGMLLDERHLEVLAEHVDLLAISLDGMPQSHNRLRSSAVAFESMAAKLGSVRASGIPFGFIFTLTQHNLNELRWVAGFAVEQGARLLQVHPLEEVGRAAGELAGRRPDEIEAAYAHVESARLQALAEGHLLVQLDLVDRDLLREQPERLFAGVAPEEAEGHLLAELVWPLVVESDGSVVPSQHGFARPYALGNLHGETLDAMAARWKGAGYGPFRALCQQLYSEAVAPAELPFFNWYEELGRRAEAHGGGQPVRST